MGYSKQVQERARKILEQRKEACVARTLARKEEVYRKLPEIAAIEKKMVHTAAGITKAIIGAPGKAGELVKQLGRENLHLQQRRADLLRSGGYPSDYLVEQHYCHDCSDTGYIGISMCQCLRNLLQAEAVKELSADVKGSFENFDISFYPDKTNGENGPVPRKRMEEIFTFCKTYANNFQTDTAESLLLLGRTGLGKTHLSLAIATSVIRAGYGVLYTPVQKLMDRMEAEKFSYDQAKKNSYAVHSQTLLECDLLILDDLGAEFVTPFTTSVLYNIVNTRLVENKPTIISTNLEPSDIEVKYSQRMVSRLTFEFKVLKFVGTDIRYMKRVQRK